MSIVEKARRELEAIDFGEEDSRVMIEIMQRFFNQWDSGGACSVVIPIISRLLVGKPLRPLTGEDSEWHTPGPDKDVYQNVRCSSVFKTKDGPAYDIDVPGRPVITFPYTPRINYD
jgi:hypothetical protein